MFMIRSQGRKKKNVEQKDLSESLLLNKFFKVRKINNFHLN